MDKGKISLAYIWGMGGLIFRRKETSICNLLNALLFFLFSRFCNNQQLQVVTITSWAATICSKSAKEITKQNCAKHTQIRAFSDAYFSVYGMETESCPYFIAFHMREKTDQKKPIFWHISRRANCKICLKLSIKTPEYVKLTIKLTIKTFLTLFGSPYC